MFHFSPIRPNGLARELRRHMEPDIVNRKPILKKYARKVDLGHGFSAHPIPTTFITTGRDSGATLENMQRDVGRADSSTTKPYDRRGHNPDKSASFFANY